MKNLEYKGGIATYNSIFIFLEFKKLLAELKRCNIILPHKSNDVELNRL